MAGVVGGWLVGAGGVVSVSCGKLGMYFSAGEGGPCRPGKVHTQLPPISEITGPSGGGPGGLFKGQNLA